MKTIKKTKKAKLYYTKTWGWHVIDYVNKSPDGRAISFGFGEDSEKAESLYNELNNTK